MILGYKLCTSFVITCTLYVVFKLFYMKCTKFSVLLYYNSLKEAWCGQQVNHQIYNLQYLDLTIFSQKLLFTYEKFLYNLALKFFIFSYLSFYKALLLLEINKSLKMAMAIQSSLKKGANEIPVVIYYSYLSYM